LDGGWVGIVEWVLGKHTANWLGFFSRDIFEKCNSYECAKKQMMSAEMVSPVYFILADGASQVIIKDKVQKNNLGQNVI